MTTPPDAPHDETALVAGDPLAAFVATLRAEARPVTTAQATAIAARARLAAGHPGTPVPATPADTPAVADSTAPATTATVTALGTWSRRLGLLAAAALVAVVGVRVADRDAPPAATVAATNTPSPAAIDATPAAAPLPAVRGTADVPVLAADARAVRLVLDAPDARSVHVVGDFNGWDRAATALEREPGTGRWSLVLPLAPGRYRYAFLVDGTTWVADPAHERVRDADFGQPTSELLVEVRP